MPDFVAMMKDVYLKIDLPEQHDTGLTLAKVVVAAVKESGIISAEIEGRIQKVD